MAGANYCYFCAQLPTLIPGNPAPMTLADFDRKLGFLPEADARYIASCKYPPDRGAKFPAGSAAAEFLTVPLRNGAGAFRDDDGVGGLYPGGKVPQAAPGEEAVLENGPVVVHQHHV